MPRPVFILGPQRSGTTLLRLMLDSHPDLSIGPESGFVRGAKSIKKIPKWPAGRGWYERYGLSERELEQRIARFYEDIFLARARRYGKSRWGEKTPFHRFSVPLLDRMFPDCQFIGVVRHPGAVLASRKRWKRYDPKAVLNDWVKSTRRMLGDADRLGEMRYTTARYEDLVSEPEATLRRVLAFLDLPWSPSVIRHHEVQPANGAPDVTDGGTRPALPLHDERLAAWKKELTPDEKQRLSTVPRALLDACGY